jgi:hypothetical protein
MLFDKNGVCYWEGSIDEDDVWDSDGEGMEDVLGDAIDQVVGKGKIASPDKKKPEWTLEGSDDEAMLYVKMPEADVTTLKGEKKKMDSLMPAGTPVLVVFIQLTPSVDIKEAKENLNSDDGGRAWKAKSIWGAYENTAQPLRSIERGFFKTKVEL